MALPELGLVEYVAAAEADTNKKYMGRPPCMLHFNDCTQTEDLRYRLLVEKGQKKHILIAWTIFSSWLLYKVTDLVGQVEELRLQLRRRP
ncbi:hypothetical protein CJ030_MR4G020927 [Morella rubra]|uniref:Uncharacterized protein n=1 Tax=Morella rubra TaxID=262757 RepID=A0A6A1VWP2_9ROSI|nr:hypothetical protein CJ030_MR4G020927 [Morella rubra]